GSGSATVYTPPTVTVNAGALCAGQTTALLTAEPSGDSYLWDNGATSQSITVTDAHGCYGVGSGSATVYTPPTVQVYAGALCAGQTTAQLTAEPGGDSYLWDNGATSQSIT